MKRYILTTQRVSSDAFEGPESIHRVFLIGPFDDSDSAVTWQQEHREEFDPNLPWKIVNLESEGVCICGPSVFSRAVSDTRERLRQP